MRAPNERALHRAADFLEASLGTDGTPADIALIEPVIAWLRTRAESRMVSEVARTAGVPAADIRAHMRRLR